MKIPALGVKWLGRILSFHWEKCIPVPCGCWEKLGDLNYQVEASGDFSINYFSEESCANAWFPVPSPRWLTQKSWASFASEWKPESSMSKTSGLAWNNTFSFGLGIIPFKAIDWFLSKFGLEVLFFKMKTPHVSGEQALKVSYQCLSVLGLGGIEGLYQQVCVHDSEGYRRS